MRTFRIVEEWTVSLALLTMAVLPILEILGRRFLGVGVPGSGPIVQHLTLWVGFLGAALAARDGKLLALATGTFIPAGRARQIAGIFSAAVAAAVATVLAWGSIDLIRAERETGTIIGAGIPAWVAQLVLPVGFGLIAARLVWRASPLWWGRLLAMAGPRRGPRPRPECQRSSRAAAPGLPSHSSSLPARWVHPFSRFWAGQRCCCS